MNEYKNGNKTAIIVLHEIYGINNFIKEMCEKLHKENVDVYCPSLIKDKVFEYSNCDCAYNYFMNKVGFDVYKKVQKLVHKLKKSYERVVIVGFSIGATIAWRCSEEELCNGIICIYGSRIRDYTDVNPKCRSLLLFAEHDSFNVDEVIDKIKDKNNTTTIKFNANHGFMDKYSCNYDKECCDKVFEYIRKFYTKLIKI